MPVVMPPSIVIVVMTEAEAASPGGMMESNVFEVAPHGKSWLLVHLLAPDDHDAPFGCLHVGPIQAIFPRAFLERPMNTIGIRYANRNSLGGAPEFPRKIVGEPYLKSNSGKPLYVTLGKWAGYLRLASC